MTTKLVKQVTPPLRRVLTNGFVGTLVAAVLNAGWLWLNQHKFHVMLSIPKSMGSDTYVQAEQWHIVLATVLAGLFGTLGSLALAKLVIAPRIWCLVVGFGSGLASLYGALTLPNQTLTQHLSLATFHAISTFSIVPSLAWALEIRHHDLVQADIKFHQHVDAQHEPQLKTVDPVMPSSGATDSLNETLVVDPSDYLPTEPGDTAS